MWVIDIKTKIFPNLLGLSNRVGKWWGARDNKRIALKEYSKGVAQIIQN